MKVVFWGVRGSIPSPLSPDGVRSKIASVVQRIKPKDLEDADSRERFLASLPPHLFGTVGGNTTCLEIRLGDGSPLIIDGGSGLRELGLFLQKTGDPARELPIFFTHLHWDHIQGIPFFTPAYIKGYKIFFASPNEGLEKTLKDQMRPPVFPVTMDVMGADIRFIRLRGEKVRVGNAEISWKEMNHPGSAYAYKIVEEGKTLIFATDCEVTDSEFQIREENRRFFDSADLLILDSQYTLEESFSKFDFGHTSHTMAVNLAVEWRVKKLVLFHHEPRYDDRKIFGMLRKARWHEEQLDAPGLPILTAQEGLEVEI
jgi:phosphoribosyl 1,2-cyclic phosphodiesterase